MLFVILSRPSLQVQDREPDSRTTKYMLLGVGAPTATLKVGASSEDVMRLPAARPEGSGRG